MILDVEHCFFSLRHGLPRCLSEDPAIDPSVPNLPAVHCNSLSVVIDSLPSEVLYPAYLIGTYEGYLLLQTT